MARCGLFISTKLLESACFGSVMQAGLLPGLLFNFEGFTF